MAAATGDVTRPLSSAPKGVALVVGQYSQVNVGDVMVNIGLEDKHLPGLVELLADQWWTSERTPTQVNIMLQGSQLTFSAVRHFDEQLTVFVRVVTGDVFITLSLDVVVARSERGRGVGSKLIDEVVAHPVVRAVESLGFVCQPALVTYHTRWGFTGQVRDSGLMRRTTRRSLIGPRSSE